MSFYTLGTSILLDIQKVIPPSVRQASLADDITGAGKLNDLETCWDNVISEGKNIGYYVNEWKSLLIFKGPELLDLTGSNFLRHWY